jgi:hypothetical protein
MKNRGTTPPIPRNSPPASLAARGSRNRGQLPRYSSRIIKVGALLTDTKSLLLAWDLNATAEAHRLPLESLLSDFQQTLQGIQAASPDDCVRLQEMSLSSSKSGRKVRIAKFFNRPLQTTEELEQAMELLRDSLQKCIDEGAVIILE